MPHEYTEEQQALLQEASDKVDAAVANLGRVFRSVGTEDRYGIVIGANERDGDHFIPMAWTLSPMGAVSISLGIRDAHVQGADPGESAEVQRRVNEQIDQLNAQRGYFVDSDSEHSHE